MEENDEGVALDEQEIVLEEDGHTPEEIAELEQRIIQARDMRQYTEELDDDVPGVDNIRESADAVLEHLENAYEAIIAGLEIDDEVSSEVSDLDSNWEGLPEDLYDSADSELSDSEDENELEPAEKERRKLARESESRSLVTEDILATSTIRFRAGAKPVTANFRVCMIVIDWNNKNKEVSRSQVSSGAKTAARIYKDLSDGRYNLAMTTKTVKVKYNFARKNLYKAANEAKMKNPGYDMYGIVHSRVRPYSNAGGNTAYFVGPLVRTILHEFGHILYNKRGPNRTVLGHAGMYVKLKGGGMKLESYGDRQDFMGKFSTIRLNAAHLVHTNWINRNGVKDKVAEHRTNDEAREYQIEKIGTKQPSNNIQAVYIPSNGRDIVFSLDTYKGNNLFKLHYLQGGGTQLAKTSSAKQPILFGGLQFERLEVDGNTARVRVSPAPGV